MRIILFSNSLFFGKNMEKLRIILYNVANKQIGGSGDVE